MRSPPYSEIVRMRLVGDAIPLLNPRYEVDCNSCAYVYAIPADPTFPTSQRLFFCAKGKFNKLAGTAVEHNTQCHFFKEIKDGVSGYPTINYIRRTLINVPNEYAPKSIDKYCLRHFKKNFHHVKNLTTNEETKAASQAAARAFSGKKQW